MVFSLLKHFIMDPHQSYVCWCVFWVSDGMLVIISIVIIITILLLDAEQTSLRSFGFSWIDSPFQLTVQSFILWKIFGRIFSKKRNSFSLKYFEVSFSCFCIKLIFLLLFPKRNCLNKIYISSLYFVSLIVKCTFMCL